MANLPRLRSITQPSKEFRSSLEERTGINNWSSDSAARTLTDTVSAAIVNNHNETVNAFEQIQISTAKGSGLDEIAMSHGVPRYQPEKAYSNKVERSVYFYVPSKTFTSCKVQSPQVPSTSFPPLSSFDNCKSIV